MTVRAYPTQRYPGRPRPIAERSLRTLLTDRHSPVRQLDVPLLAAALALTLIGTLLVFSATRGRGDLTGGDPYFYLLRHVMNGSIGLGLAAVLVWLGHDRLRTGVPVLYLGSLLLSLVVLSPLGTTVNGSRSWLRLGGGFAFQPSELVKIGVILAMATLLAAHLESDARQRPDYRVVLQALTLAAVPAVLILLAPDVGQTMVVVAIALGVLLAAGTGRAWLFGLLGTGVAGALAVWQLGILDDYQIDRFAAFANPSLDPAGVGYNTNQARIAIGAGGLLGQGLFNGGQTIGQFVPEQHTDFIFTVAGEELGFVGSALILSLLGVVLWRACRIAMRASDLYGTLTAAGIVTWLAFQSFQNIGMALGITPVTGLPLPFLSYGGSAMFAVWIAIGLLLAIDARARGTGSHALTPRPPLLRGR